VLIINGNRHNKRHLSATIAAPCDLTAINLGPLRQRQQFTGNVDHTFITGSLSGFTVLLCFVAGKITGYRAGHDCTVTEVVLLFRKGNGSSDGMGVTGGSSATAVREVMTAARQKTT